MNDIIKEILPILNIKTLMSFRRTCRQIDSLLDFNYWIDKFHEYDLPILATKLPTKVAEWIKEYITVCRTIREVENLIENHKEICLIVNLKKWFYNPKYYLTPDELITFFPSFAYSNNGSRYGFVINVPSKTMGFIGFTACRMEEHPEGSFSLSLFLARLIYYNREVNLTAPDGKSIRKRHIYV